MEPRSDFVRLLIKGGGSRVIRQEHLMTFFEEGDGTYFANYYNTSGALIKTEITKDSFNILLRDLKPAG